MSIQRKEKVIEKMKEKNIDLIILVPDSNLYYLTGNSFSASERLLLYFLQKNGKGFYLVPKVEKTKLKITENDEVISYSDKDGPLSVRNIIKTKLSEHPQVAVEDDMRLFEWHFLKELEIVKARNFSEVLKNVRIVKQEEEIMHLRRATHILEKSLQATLPIIEVGKTENEIAARLEYEMKIRGSEGTPFSTIVASGSRGALPHGRASEKVIENGDLIVIDFGSIVNGYVGDMTRTIGVGDISKEKRYVYDIVKSAIINSINTIEIGIQACEIDAVARKIISDAGYGEYFTHRLGHGIGLDAHEEPYISPSNKELIRPGMSFTIEPGIYIENQFGIRIEDDVVVTEDGIENLMNTNHELIII